MFGESDHCERNSKKPISFQKEAFNKCLLDYIDGPFDDRPDRSAVFYLARRALRRLLAAQLIEVSS